MLTPIEQNPYSVETKNEHKLKFSKIEADNEAINFQETGKDVEVWHRGFLQYKLHGVEQGKLF
tara:strand:- start:120 stop:308 length:189 start_codon:yes stop_codon:yes gene_type:complete